MFLQGIFQKWKVQWGQEFLLIRKEVGEINLFSNDHCKANDNNKLFKVSKLPEILNLEQCHKEIAITVFITTIKLEIVLGNNVQESGILKLFRSRLIHSFIRSLVHPFILSLTT